MTVSANPRPALPRPIASWLALAVGLVLSLGMAWVQHDVNQDRLRDALHDDTRRVAANLAARMRQLDLALQGARGLALTLGWERLTRADFEAYSRSLDLDREFTGVRGIGLIHRVRPEQEADFLARAGADLPGLALRALAPHDGERFVSLFIEPAARNLAAIGLDIASDPRLRSAALSAQTRGTATLSAPIALAPWTTPPRPGFLLLLPVYGSADAAALPGRPERRPALGWAYAPLLADELFAGLRMSHDDYQLRIADVQTDAVQPLFDGQAATGASATPGLSTWIDQAVLGRTWRVELVASPAFAARLNLNDPIGVALLGLALTVLATLALRAQQRARDTARELRVEQERRAMALQTSGDAVVMVDPQGRVFDWNQGAQDLFGHAASEVLGRDVADVLVPAARRDETLRMLQAGQQGLPTPAFDTERLHRLGHAIDVSIIAAPLHSPDGAFAGVAQSMRDIRRAKQAEQEILELNTTLEHKVRERTAELHAALRESAAFLRTVHTHAIVSVTDRFGVITDANDNFCRISGYARDELVGRKHNIVNSGRMPADFWSGMWRTISDGQPWRGVVCNRARDGSLYWVDSLISPVTGADDRVERYVSVRFDVTAAVLAQEGLRASEQLLSRTGQLAKVGGWLLDLRQDTLHWTAQTKRIHEVAQDYLPQRETAIAFFAPEARAAVQQALDQAVSEQRGWDLELPLITATDRRVWVRFVGEPDLEDGAVVRVAGAIQDITERRQAEDELRRSNAELEQFAYIASHDLQEPLRMVVSYTELLAQRYQGQLDAKADKYIFYAVDGGRRMQRLVADLLAFSRVGSQGKPLQPVSAQTALERVLGGLRAQIADSGAQVDAEPLPTVLADPTQLEQLLQNLIGNAIKFRGEAPPRICIRVTRERQHWRFSVQDNGIGIDMQYADRIFQMFQRLHERGRYEGSGIGLAIVKRIVERHGGHIELESVLGEGTTFHFSLQAA